MVVPTATPTPATSLQIRLKASPSLPPTLRTAHNATLSVPSTAGPKALNKLVSHLLSTGIQFSFLIRNEPLRTTLSKYIFRRQVSSEETLEILYYTPLPQPDVETPRTVCADWISSISLHDTTPHKTSLLIGCYDGSTSIHSETGDTNPTSTGRLHSNAVKDVAWLPSGDGFISVSNDQTARLWSFSELCTEHVATFDTRAILSAACLNAVAVSASRAALAGQDGSLWVAHDLSVPLRKTRVGEKRGGACELAATKIGHVSTGLALTCVEMRENRAVTCGLDSFARVWDVEKCSATSTVPCGGKAVLCMSGTDEGLVVGAVDGGLRAIDLRDGGGVSAACGSVKGHVGGIGDVCVWGDVYVSGGFDGSLRFWDRRWMGVPVRVVENVCGGKVLAVAGRRGRGRVWAGGEGGVLGAVCVEGE